ncbi:hypothetical protein M2282_000540 [Variovorax boronicumulans]|nr:hypothetical protein [Variovorax boronicumulans]
MPLCGLGVKREAGALRLHGRIHSCAAPATVSGFGKPRVDVPRGIGSHCASAWEGEGFGFDAHAQCHRSAPQARIPAFATAIGRCGSAGPGMPLQPLRDRPARLPPPSTPSFGQEPAGTQVARRSHMGQASPARDRVGAPLQWSRLSGLSLGLGLAFGSGGALAQSDEATGNGSNDKSLAPVQVEASRHTPLALQCRAQPRLSVAHPIPPCLGHRRVAAVDHRHGRLGERRGDRLAPAAAQAQETQGVVRAGSAACAPTFMTALARSTPIHQQSTFALRCNTGGARCTSNQV